jgi:uncharacterized membrane protein (DUF2068 family)
MDWNLVGCAGGGHVTYAPDEPALRDRLMVPAAGRHGLAVPALRRVRHRRAAWRRAGRGGAADPPGRRAAQRADPARVRGGTVPPLPDLRARGLRAWRFTSDRAGIERAYNNDLPAVGALYRDLGFDVHHSRLFGLIQHSFMLTPRTLTYLAIGLAGYALIELVESIGLWLGQRRGEYFAMVATSIFLPYEIYDLTGKITWLRLAALIINLLLVIYLVWAKRLFGIRGGKTACAASPSSRWNRPRSPRYRPASPVTPSPLTRRFSRPAINHAVAALRQQDRNRSWTGPAARLPPARPGCSPGGCS